MSSDVVRLSKRLSWLLRHGAGSANLVMDEAGWVAVGDVLDNLGITPGELDLAVARNDKARLVVDGGRIRACQGHSLAGMPVTLEGLEGSWECVTPTNALWHGTRIGAIGGIANNGILAGSRTHVHLAASLDSRVGKRSSVDFLLEVSPLIVTESKVGIFQAPNGVILIRRVPGNSIVGLRPTSPSGSKYLMAARTTLGLAEGEVGRPG